MLGELEVIREMAGYPVLWGPKTLRSMGAITAASVQLLHPIIGSVIGYAIVVDKRFYTQCQSCQKFILLHEVGHLTHGDLGTEAFSGILDTHGLHGIDPREAAADQYAYDRLSVEELKAVYGMFCGFAVSSIFIPGLRDTRLRAKAVKEEIRKRKKAKKLAAIVA